MSIVLEENNIPILREGVVKFFNTERGFGFIAMKNPSQSIFVHSSGLIDEIQENDNVTFDLEEGDKGLNAVNVELMEQKS